MKFANSRKQSSLALSAIVASMLLFSSSSVIAKLYKWVDENGNTHYSTSLPPEATDLAREELNKSGRVVDAVDDAPTADEIKHQEELERLRQEKAILIKKQKEEDSVLLKTFRSENDLVVARNLKLSSLDNLINITQGNIKRFKEKLSILQSQAAKQETSGKVVDQKIIEDIESLQRQIENGYESIANREVMKEEIFLDYDRDIKRFRVLKDFNVGKATPTYKKQTLPLKTVYYCEDDNDCNTAWERAKAYIKQHATTPLQLVGKNLYMTSSPVNDNDITLSLSRIKNTGDGKEKIFLDQQCKNSPLGIEFCYGETSNSIKDGFIPALLGQ